MSQSGTYGKGGGGGSGILTITGDTGGPLSPTAGNINIFGGANINTAGASSTLTVNLDTSVFLPATTADTTQGVIAIGNMQIHTFSNINEDNTLFIGASAGNFTNNASQNLGIGQLVFNAITTGSQNVSIGMSAGFQLQDGANNTFVGYSAAPNMVSGHDNICIGQFSGTDCPEDSSFNIMIGSTGDPADASGVIRIGESSLEQSTCYIQGIASVSVSNLQFVTIDTTTGQLGSSASGSTDIEFDTDSGNATSVSSVINMVGGANINTAGASSTVTINLNDSISLPNTNSSATQGMYSLGSNRFMYDFGTRNTFLGSTAGNLALTATDLTCVGYLSGNALTSSFGLTAVGSQSFPVCMGGTGSNTGLGYASGFTVNTGSANTFIGAFSGSGITSGVENIFLGFEAGSSYTSTESSNIMIGNNGILGESNVIRIGVDGSGSGEQDTCFIAGIAGATVANSAAVLIDTTTGQLGTLPSSLRYKENIVDMDEVSNNIYQLRPVSFSYKKDDTKKQQFGLIAEEVAEIFPQLVNYDKDGNPDSVHYHDLPVLLLNEIKKLKDQISRLQKEL